jgi:methyl-accepting chemotaxis protein
MKNIKIGSKLIISFLFIAAIMAFMGAYLINSLKTLDKHTKLIYEEGMVPLELIVEASQQIQELRMSIQRWQVAKTNEERAAAVKTIGESYAILKEVVAKQSDEVIVEDGEKPLDNLLIASGKYVAEAYDYIRTARIDYVTGLCAEKLSPTVLTAANEMSRAVAAAIEIRHNSAKKLLESNSKVANHSQEIAIAILIIVLIFSFCFALSFTFSITQPLHIVVEALSKIEQGNMTVRADLERGDEFGSLSKALDSLAAKLLTIFRNLRQNANTLSNSAEELSGIGTQVTNATEQVTVNINAMASNAAKTSDNADKVAGTADQMSTNMSTIATAVEEMSTSISQIANNASDASKIANESTVKSGNATSAMSKLGAAAEEIGQVTNVIKNIADKTNLLALNATIEAASAGEAGKGFAVVAGEIKELANQSAKSADDIARRIQGIQVGTGEAVRVINDVSDIIAKINQSIETISSHVGQQTKASNEIANNVAQANIGIKRVAESIGEVAKGSKDMARSVEDVAKGSISVQKTKQINQGADELARLASDLKGVLLKFSL